MRQDTATERSFRRRIALISLLHTQPHSYAEIIAALDCQQLLDYDRFAETEIIDRQKKNQFNNDKKALKASGLKIKWERHRNCYVWHNSPFKLALNSNQLDAFALLLNTFEDTKIPYADQMQELLRHIYCLLPPDQQKIISSHRSFSINLRETTDYRTADPATLAEIERAIQCGQQLEFCYISSKHGQQKYHKIEPQPLVFERGHVYLCGWSLTTEQELRYRLDKIVVGSAKMLPTAIAPIRRTAPRYLLQYWLSPTIARQDVSHNWPEQQVERHLDGSATITAFVTNFDLFEVRRHLLGYGANCRVIAPPQLVTQMCETVKELYQFYCKQG